MYRMAPTKKKHVPSRCCLFQMMKLCLLNVVNGGSKIIRVRQNFPVLSCVYMARFIDLGCTPAASFRFSVFKSAYVHSLVVSYGCVQQKNKVFFALRDGNLLLSNMFCYYFQILYLYISLPFGQHGGSVSGFRNTGWKLRQVVGSGFGRHPHSVEIWLDW